MAYGRRLVTIPGMWRIRILVPIGFALAMFQANAAPTGTLPCVVASIVPEIPHVPAEKPGPGVFLVAKRALGGSYFRQSVVFLIEHDENGSLGLIVNRSSEIRLADALPDIESGRATAHRLYYGGPVEPSVITMLLRGQSATPGMAHVVGSVYVSADRRVLDRALAANKDAGELRIYFGYSGWGAGQLDFELGRGSWHVVKADPDAVFSADSDSLWERLIEQLEPEGMEVRDLRRHVSRVTA